MEPRYRPAVRGHAAQQPDTVAFFMEDARLTYAGLHERANRLAHYLIASGMRPGDRVGVAVEKSLDAPVALLAVFKAGGVYVPLDPHYPAERLRFMVEDSEVGRIITRERWLEALAGSARRVRLPGSYCGTRSPGSPTPTRGSHLPPTRRLHRLHLRLDRRARRGARTAPADPQPAELDVGRLSAAIGRRGQRQVGALLRGFLVGIIGLSVGGRPRRSSPMRSCVTRMRWWMHWLAPA